MSRFDLQQTQSTRQIELFKSTTKDEVMTSRPGALRSSDMYFYFEISMFLLTLGSFVAVLGIISNVINIAVYHHQGVKDSATVTFIALSLWDLGNCLTSLVSNICLIIENQFPISAVNVLAVQYVYFAYTRGCMYVLSTVVTMYLSVERCICIIIPFRVRGIFTKSSSIVTNVVIFVFCALCFCPAWATQGLQLSFDPKFNRTRLLLWLAPDRREIDMFVDTFNGVVLPTIAQVVITICAGLMISGIKTSAKFRQHAVGVSALKEEQSEARNSSTQESTKGLNTKAKLMSSKDFKLAKVVVLVALIFFICNLPVLLAAIVRALVPELDIGKQYNNLYYVVYIIVYDFGLINSSVNILVYYSVSSRYREGFLSLFWESKTKITK